MQIDSKTWKQAATANRGLRLQAEEMWTGWRSLYSQEKALADRRLELLREVEWGWVDNGIGRCPECGGFEHNDPSFRIENYPSYKIGHWDGCELAEELGDGDN